MGNPIESPPVEIVYRGLEPILNYFNEIEEKGSDYLYEAKMLAVGAGGVGKTSLCKKILDANYTLQPESTGDTTEGIDIFKHQFKFNRKRSFNINIWDFGGQEIYHATHQFFLTKRSLYVLVTDTRKEDDDLPYWLNIQQLLAGDSPLLIIQNEKHDRVKPLKMKEISKSFINVKGFLQTNLKSNRGLKRVIERIEFELKSLPHIGDKLPKSWVKIRNSLESIAANFISQKMYFDICAGQGMTEKKKALWLSEYLHDLGVILHFKEDPILGRIIILKNEWATDAVYKVLDDKKVKENWGKFSFTDLEKIWVVY